jgi:predicted HD phosphohydrolase
MAELMSPPQLLAYTSAMRRRQMAVADEVIEQLRKLGGGPSGLMVNRLDHSLQTASRAEKADRSDPYVLAALLHDIGDCLAPLNHAALAAAVLEPYLPEDLHWMVLHHGEFQMYYIADQVGGDRDAREPYRGHQWFDMTVEFCEEFDHDTLDPKYPKEPLEHFTPLIRALIK